MSLKKAPNRLKTIIVIIGTIVLVLIILSFFTATDAHQAKKSGQAEDQESYIAQNLISFLQKEAITKPVINENSPVLGNPDAPLTIFEFNSFGCKFGLKVQPIIKQLLEKYPDKIKLVWKDLPLPDIYPNADLIHQAARCAQKQNKFWEYHDEIWPIGGEVKDDVLRKTAEAIDLNLDSFDKCIQNQTGVEIIDRDVLEANQLLIPGTPYFYIGAQEITGQTELADFEKLIEVELNRPIDN